MCEALEESHHTSALLRIKEIEADSASARYPLAPIAGIKGFAVLCMTQAEYLSLLDVTDRQLRADKHGAINGSAPAILRQLGCRPERWTPRVMGNRLRFQPRHRRCGIADRKSQSDGPELAAWHRCREAMGCGHSLIEAIPTRPFGPMSRSACAQSAATQRQRPKPQCSTALAVSTLTENFFTSTVAARAGCDVCSRKKMGVQFPIAQQAQIGQYVLDFGALEERSTATDAIRHTGQTKRFFPLCFGLFDYLPLLRPTVPAQSGLRSNWMCKCRRRQEAEDDRPRISPIPQPTTRGRQHIGPSAVGLEHLPFFRDCISRCSHNTGCVCNATGACVWSYPPSVTRLSRRQGLQRSGHRTRGAHVVAAFDCTDQGAAGAAAGQVSLGQSPGALTADRVG